MDAVRVWVPSGETLLDDITWVVRPGEHWLVLGHNGAGKTTLLSLAAAVRHPSAGSVEVLGHRLGRVDTRELRAKIGTVDGSILSRTNPRTLGRDVVLTGASGTVLPLYERYGPADHARAADLMDLLGCAQLADRRLATCSLGERQRLVLARALMSRPLLLLLDEPMTGLDFPAREALLDALTRLAAAWSDRATVLVTHHLEEVPPSTTHALLLGAGRIVAQGPVAETLTNEMVSATYGVPVTVHRRDDRWSAVAHSSFLRGAETAQG
ncbi:MAG: ABC transporter ATP-binding protein [Frankia sp.]